MDCHKHAGTASAGACAGCAEGFCDSCLVVVGGTGYCASCKQLAIANIRVVPTVDLPEAKQALWFALGGLFGFGCWLTLILEPIAIAKALEARRRIQADPALGGKGYADAALTVSIFGLLIGALSLFSTFNR
ncbi:MAG: hypothetical protein QM767_01620 [Anaeromyxobacter sp.]